MSNFATVAKMINYGKSFLLWYAHDLMNFRVQELRAITSMFNIRFEWLEPPSTEDPFLLINLSSPSDIERIMSRTVLVRSAYELWAHGQNRSCLHHNLKQIPKHFIGPFCQADASFRVDVEGFGKKIPSSVKVDRINELAFLEFEGPVKLNKPDHTFILMEYYGTDRNNVPEHPYRLFFGRWISDGQRNVSHKINLKTRKFIGNTSMDPLLSLVMANFAQVQNGDLVLDPFVGSGSILVAAAHFGGYVLGTDIDYLMLHGRAKPTRCNEKRRQPDESVRANFKQYSMESHYLDVLVADASLPLWRTSSVFDAIITDPPYGIREPTERIGTEKNYKIPDDLVANHIPSKITYSLDNIIKDLLDFSACCLKVNGRLVFWMPLYKEDFKESALPNHPCLSLVSYCEQSMTNHSSRFLIIMEKTKENADELNKASVPESALSFRHKYFQAHRKKFLQKNTM